MPRWVGLGVHVEIDAAAHTHHSLTNSILTSPVALVPDARALPTYVRRTRSQVDFLQARKGPHKGLRCGSSTRGDVAMAGFTKSAVEDSDALAVAAASLNVRS